MKVHLIKKQSIDDYAAINPRSKRPLEDWLAKVKYADWEMPTDIQATFKTADLLGKGCSRVVFDIGGNNYRMICKYAFGKRQVHLFVCWLATHAEYDILNKGQLQYTINVY